MVKRDDKGVILKPTEADLFTDREEILNEFEKALSELTPDAPKVLILHGISGIGKSEIKDEIDRRLTARHGAVTGDHGEPEVDNENYRLIWQDIDFTESHYRNPDNALIYIRSKLVEGNVWNVPFRCFDIAYAIRWKMLNPATPLNLDTFNVLVDSEIMKDVLSLVGQVVPGVGLVPTVARFIKNTTSELKEWWTKKRNKSLEELEAASPTEVGDELPRLFGDDLSYYLRKRKLKVVVFLDAYEKLWDTSEKRAQHKYNKTDSWVRDLIKASPGVLFIITGQDGLRWGELSEWDEEWSKVCTILPVEEFTGGYCKEYLNSAKIFEDDIHNKIIDGSRRVPGYIGLSIDTYYEIRRKEKTPTVNDFGGTFGEIFDKFVTQLSDAEVRTLVVLGPTRSFDFSLFKAAIEKFGTGLPFSVFNEFTRFSFFSKDEISGIIYIHDLLSDHLRTYVDEEEWVEYHAFLYDYFKPIAEVEDPKTITEENLAALDEALYHGLKLSNIDSVTDWFAKVFNIYYNAAIYVGITSIYEFFIEEVKEELYTGVLNLVIAYANLAELYRAQGKYREAGTLFNRSLKHIEIGSIAKRPEIAAVYNNLGKLRYSQGEYEEAIEYYKRALAIYEEMRDTGNLHTAILLNNLGETYRTLSEYSKAEVFFGRSLEIFQVLEVHNYKELGNVLNNLALVYQSQDRFEEAESLYQQALNIRKAELGPNHPDVGQTLLNLAGLRKTQGLYGEAESFIVQGLEIMKKALGKNHPDFATALNILADLYATLGRNKESLKHYLRALSIRKYMLGRTHPNTATTLNNIALLYFHIGRFRRAEFLYGLALNIVEIKFGPDNATIAKVLNNLADLYVTQARYEEAKILYNRSLGIYQTSSLPMNIDEATVLNNLAKLFTEWGHYEKAGKHFRKSIEVIEEALGPNHPSIATVLNNLAGLYYRQGFYEKAEPIYLRDLKVSEKKLGVDHPNTAKTLNNLSELYRALDRFGESERLCKRALGIREVKLGPDHPDVAESLSTLAGIYECQSELTKAIPLRERALEIFEQAFGREHPYTAGQLNNLAYVNLLLSNIKEALEYQERAHSIFEVKLPKNHPNVINSLQGLAIIYSKLGQPEKANEYALRAEELQASRD